MCIADRSLSRLRGSPLPGAGCLGPKFCVRCIYPAHRDCLGPLSRVGAFALTGAAAAAMPPGRVWVGCAPGLRLGAWPSSCVGAFALPGTAAAAVPPGRVWVGCAPGLRLGAWPSSCVGAFILPGTAAAAVPPVRVWVAVPLWVRPGAWPRGCAADTPDIDAPFSAL